MCQYNHIQDVNIGQSLNLSLNKVSNDAVYNKKRATTDRCFRVSRIFFRLWVNPNNYDFCFIFDDVLIKATVTTIDKMRE